MNYGWNDDHRVRANKLILCFMKDRSINIWIEPVLYYYIPLSVVFSDFSAIPPRSVKLSVTESQDFSECVVPTVKKSKKY